MGRPYVPHCAMKRLALPLLLSLALPCLGSTPQEILTKRYKDFNSIVARRDPLAMKAWVTSNCGPKFSYLTYHKRQYDRDAYMNQLLAQMAKTSQVLKSTTTVRSFQKAGNGVMAVVASDFKGVIAVESGKSILTEQSVAYETWMPVGKEWKLQKVVQVNEDVQMSSEAEG